jgi:nitroreductase
MDFIEQLNWRYACKKMDPSKKVSEDHVERILEAARLAPTSSGLQPLEVLVVTNGPIREKIQAIAWNQGMVTDCSHLLVFAAWDDYTPERINFMFDLTNEVRGFKNEGWEAYRQQLLAGYPPRGPEVNFQHAARQCYIAMAAATFEAAFLGVDTTPMEGFDPEALDQILDLRAQKLRSVLMLPLGYREADKDWLVNLPKVRRPMDQFTRRID